MDVEYWKSVYCWKVLFLFVLLLIKHLIPVFSAYFELLAY
jgi:hypothetical protein